MLETIKKSQAFLQRTLVLVVLLFSSLGYSQSTSRLDSLTVKLNQATNDSLEIIYEIKLSRELHRQDGDENEEYAYAKKAIEGALHLKDTLLYARALDNFGLLQRFHRHYEEAFDLHGKAFKLVENRKDIKPIFKMIFSDNAGIAARYQQKYATAISYYMKALKIAEEENELRNIAIASNGIGNALSNIPDREDEALQYFLRALETEKKRGNDLGLAMNYHSVSSYFIDKGDYSTAREYLAKLLQLNKKMKNKFGLAITFQYYGISYMKEGKNLDKAVSYLENALKRFKTLNNISKQSAILKYLGTIQLKKGNLIGAENYFRKSLALVNDRKQYEMIRATSMKLSQVLEKRGKHQQALYYYKQADAYKDSIKLTDQNVRIEALTRKYNLEKKENRIQLLEKDKVLQQTALQNQKQQLERRRIIMVLLTVGLLLLLIIFLLQYRNYRTKKKTTARLQKQEKEKMNAIYERNLAQSEILVTRLRVNPHFLFNSLNAITYLIQSEQNRKAIKYLKVFSRYTRMVLETSKQHVVPLQEELKLANYYLILEENRFEKGFTYKITGDDLPEIDAVFIPPLLLQPFLENAIWHGLLPSKKVQRILNIKIIPLPKSIQVIIEDNGVGRTVKKPRSIKKPHKSMGTQIIKERIELFNQSYPKKIDFEIIDKTAKDGHPAGTKVIINLFRE